MFHAYGLFVNIHSIILGHTLVIMRKFNEERFLSIIQQYRVRKLEDKFHQILHALFENLEPGF